MRGMEAWKSLLGLGVRELVCDEPTLLGLGSAPQGPGASGCSVRDTDLHVHIHHHPEVRRRQDLRLSQCGPAHGLSWSCDIYEVVLMLC